MLKNIMIFNYTKRTGRESVFLKVI